METTSDIHVQFTSAETAYRYVIRPVDEQSMGSVRTGWKQLRNDTIQRLQKYGYIFYLVLWLSAIDIFIIDLRFYTIIIPMIILVNWKCRND